MMPPAGFEPATSRLAVQRSIQLSYGGPFLANLAQARFARLTGPSLQLNKHGAKD